jgi:hypothetical protein
LLAIVPPEADQVTDVLLVPEIMATKSCCPPVGRLLVVGEIEMETWVWTATVTVAELDLVGSAALVAVTV